MKKYHAAGGVRLFRRPAQIHPRCAPFPGESVPHLVGRDAHIAPRRIRRIHCRIPAQTQLVIICRRAGRLRPPLTGSIIPKAGADATRPTTGSNKTRIRRETAIERPGPARATAGRPYSRIGAMRIRRRLARDEAGSARAAEGVGPYDRTIHNNIMVN